MLTLIVVLILPLSSFAIGKRVSGEVIDSITGEHLPYANIISKKNGKENKVADENGRFSIYINGDGTDWFVSYAGYEPKPLPMDSDKGKVVIRLSPLPQYLSEVIVKPKKGKYSKKNNPAVEFIKRLRKMSEKNDPSKMPYYSYDKYEKTLIGINDFKGDSVKGFWSKGGKFLMDYVDTSSWTGKRILDLILKEKLSRQIMAQDPKLNKEIIKGYKSGGLNTIVSEENVQIMLEDAIREIDIYDNSITFLQNRFVSPLSQIGPDFYKYYLTDTVYVGDEKCIELSFVPHNAQSMGFNGKIFVPLGDTTMFVKKVTMRVPQDINLNYVDNIFLNQSFEKDSLGNRHKVYDDVCLEMRIAPGTPSVYGRKTTVYDKFSYEKQQDLSEFYDRLGNVFDLDGARNQDSGFWNANRMVPLSVAESRMGDMMGRIRRIPFLYWAEKVISVLESGYIKTGNPSKFDIGPINTFLSFNNVEGMRLRAGGMTMAALNPHLFAEGYVAYGTKDKKWKYRGALEYSFHKKKEHFREFPRHAIFGSYSYDLNMMGQRYSSGNQDNFFLSFRRKDLDLVTYQRLFRLGYILELRNNFSIEANFTQEKQESTPWIPFVYPDGRRDSYYKQTLLSVTLRWAPGEKFIQTVKRRRPVNMDAWVFHLTHDIGPKGIFGSTYTLNRTTLSIDKRLWFSAFGYADITLGAGKIWSTVLFPALLWPNANLSYVMRPGSYSLMNPMEFANDEYASIDLTYFGNGILFNRIPLIKKLKLREVFTFKSLWGGLSDKNNPSKNKNIYEFPFDAHPRVMSSTPYMEIGVGLDNIFTFLRLDYVWRLSYRDTPDCDKSGLRISAHFSF